METKTKIMIGLGVLVALAIVAVLIFVKPFSKKDEGKSEETEQVEPTPVFAQVEIPAALITGEYAWSNIPASKQSQLIETVTPDLKGEKILLAHKVKGVPSGKTLVWIQTEAADGSVRNILTDEKNVLLK